MAASTITGRHVLAISEDKYFPEKNATIPFKWETSPGKPKYDSDEDDGYECLDSYTSIQKDNNHCLQASHIHTSHLCSTTSIYPLRPPPKLSPAKPLHVKDLLLNAGTVRDLALSDHPSDEDYLCPLQTYHHGSFSRLAIRFRPFKASTVVPIGKNRCVMKQLGDPGVDKSQASPLLVKHGASALHGRSQSFNHGAAAAAKTAANHSDVAEDESVHALRRRCNSFSFHSPLHHSAIHPDNKVQDDDDDDDDDPSSMAAAAVWAGARMLAAAAAHSVVSTNHHEHGPCRVAMKLRDLLQQSTNFSEFELPATTNLKPGGGNVINENLAQLALCHATIKPAEKTKTEEGATEAILREGVKMSCTHDEDDDVEVEPREEVTQQGNDQPGKLVKRRRFVKVFKNECIACWCPSSSL